MFLIGVTLILAQPVMAGGTIYLQDNAGVGPTVDQEKLQNIEKQCSNVTEEFLLAYRTGDAQTQTRLNSAICLCNRSGLPTDFPDLVDHLNVLCVRNLKS